MYTKTPLGHLPPYSSGRADDVSLEGTSFCKNLLEFVFISYPNNILDQNHIQLDFKNAKNNDWYYTTASEWRA
jgi:hypothetical protein